MTIIINRSRQSRRITLLRNGQLLLEHLMEGTEKMLIPYFWIDEEGNYQPHIYDTPGEAQAALAQIPHDYEQPPIKEAVVTGMIAMSGWSCCLRLELQDGTVFARDYTWSQDLLEVNVPNALDVCEAKGYIIRKETIWKEYVRY